MTRTLKIVILGFLGATTYGTIFAPSALAGCGRPNENRAEPPPQRQASRVQAGVYRPAAFPLGSDRDDEDRAPRLWDSGTSRLCPKAACMYRTAP
jgi:hypothetical protein